MTNYLLPGANLFKCLKLRWQWRQLKWAVAAASEAAQGHEANGVRPGSQEFKTLYSDVARKLNWEKEMNAHVEQEYRRWKKEHGIHS